MNVDYLVEEFKNKYDKKNYILNAMLYSLQSLDNVEKRIIEIVNLMQNKLNDSCNKNYDLKCVIKTMIYLYNSQRIIFNLPHMNNKTIDKLKPCLHIIYGEMLTQLTSITLFSEALETINNINTSNKIKTKNIKILNLDNLKINDKLFVHNLKNYKSILKDDYNKKIEEIYTKTKKICLNLYGLDTNNYDI